MKTALIVALTASALFASNGVALAQGSPLVPTIPQSFGIDTVATFHGGTPGNAPHGSKSLAASLEAAFQGIHRVASSDASAPAIRMQVPSGSAQAPSVQAEPDLHAAGQ